MTETFKRDPATTAIPGTAQYCTFLVAGLYFGIDVRRVQEVLRSQDVTPVPQAPAVIAGLINLRGQIVPAVDMRRRLGLADRPAQTQSMNMVIRSEEGAASLLVDEIGDVLDVDGAAFEPIPDNLAPEQRELIRGVCKLRDRLLLVLDAERALELAGTQTGAGIA